MFDGTVTTGAARLANVAAAIADEATVRDALIECAAQPTLDAMRANLESHRRHNPSIVDGIGITIEPGEIGAVRVNVGTLAGNKQGFVLRFIERGTSKQPATPWARPARDQVEPSVAGRMTAWLRDRMSTFTGAA